MSLLQVMGGVLIIGSTFISEIFSAKHNHNKDMDIIEETGDR